MSWTFRLLIQDVTGASIAGAELDRSVSTGGGRVTFAPPTTVDDGYQFTVDDAARTVTLGFRHARYGMLSLLLVRSDGESVWRWNDPQRLVVTEGRTVTVEATLSRAQQAPRISLPEDLLKRRAEQVKAPRDAEARRRAAASGGAPVLPAFVNFDNQQRVLASDAHLTYRRSGMPPQPAFQLAEPDLLGDATASGWGRFHAASRDVQPGRDGQLHLVEYGEIGTAGRRMPRFLVAVWLPNVLATLGRAEMDFLVWLTPNTNPNRFPIDSYPFRGDYPYVISAVGGGSAPYEAAQPYVGLGIAHLSVQHYLAYQLLAARRAAAIVIPIAPTSHFELFQSRPTLMRLLKEVCLWIPRATDRSLARVYPRRPRIGRVGVAGFSASVPRLGALIHSSGADHQYRDPVWGSTADAVDMDRAWRELWAIDGYFQNHLPWFSGFVQAATLWSRQQPDRRLRLYKNDHTDGRWDPRAEPSPAFKEAMKGGRVTERASKSAWAVSMEDRAGRIFAASFSQAYVLGAPGAKQVPELKPAGPHEMMPRFAFGHAAATSGFTRL